MDEKIPQAPSSLATPRSQPEDAALKACMQFFAEELLPYLGISGKVASIAPTELVHLEVQKFLQDFNLFMEDGTLKHFEFQSTNPGLAGLKRFRIYEALASSHYKRAVTTYVLYSGTIRNPMTEFTEGINTYRIIPIIMQDKNADDFFAALRNKFKNHLPLSREDLIPLPLCLLMGGEMPLTDRVRTAYQITGSIPEELFCGQRDPKNRIRDLYPG